MTLHNVYAIGSRRIPIDCGQAVDSVNFSSVVHIAAIFAFDHAFKAAFFVPVKI